MNNQIILTGHTRGIGRSLLSLLLDNQYQNIVGISRTVLGLSKVREISTDLSDPVQVRSVLPLLEVENPKYLILNAGGNSIKPAESYTFSEVERLFYLNLVSPSLILRACLPALLRNQGHIIVIGSYSALEIRRWNNYYGSAKAGIHHLAKNIFEQYRKQNLRVSLIVPDIVSSEFYSHQDFKPDVSAEFSISPVDVARLIFNMIDDKTDYIPLELVIRPQMFRLDRR